MPDQRGSELRALGHTPLLEQLGQRFDRFGQRENFLFAKFIQLLVE